MKKLEDIDKSYFGPRMSDGAGVFVAGFVFLYIFQIVLLLIGELNGINLDEPPVWFNWIMMVVNQAALVSAVAAYSAVSHKRLLEESRITRKLNYKQALIIPVIALASILAFLPLAEGFVRLIYLITKGSPSGGLDIGTKWWEIIISVVFVAVLPAIGEELLFRAGVARGLKRKNYLFAIIMSGLLFSIFHGNAEQTVHQFFIGMVFAYLYFVTGSLLASMICHFANNAFVIIFSAITSSKNVKMSPAVEISMYIGMFVVGIVALYFLLGYIMKLSKDAKYKEKTKYQLNWLKDLSNTLKNLFDDPCDGISLDYDLEKKGAQADNANDQSKYTSQMPANEFNSQNQQTISQNSNNGQNLQKTNKNVNNSQDNQMDKLLEEANLQTIKKRNKFDWYALIAATGISLAVWIINLVAQV